MVEEIKTAVQHDPTTAAHIEKVIDSLINDLELRVDALNTSASTCDIKEVSALSFNMGAALGRLETFGRHRSKEWQPIIDRYAAIVKEINGLCIPRTGKAEIG